MLGSRSAYTRARILDVAERLFAQKGHEATSLREITAVARVNSSSVHYHFGSKEGLVQAVFNQLMETLNRERVSLLEACMATNKDGAPLQATQVIDAYFRPLIRYASRHSVIRQAFLPTTSLTANEGCFIPLIPDADTEIGQRFRQALSESFPSLPKLEIIWRLRLMMVAICCALHYTDGLYLASQLDDADLDKTALSRRLLDFLTIGVQGAFSDQWMTMLEPPASSTDHANESSG